jgi:hypothetical protein
LWYPKRNSSIALTARINDEKETANNRSFFVSLRTINLSRNRLWAFDHFSRFFVFRKYRVDLCHRRKDAAVLGLTIGFS